jgi:pyruvate/2-oxoglutarate dehydrogenase complex dihydrolipoamide acyltransferase (E2) component
VETDKALVEVSVPVGGVVLELLVDPDDEIRTGEPFIVLETS